MGVTKPPFLLCYTSSMFGRKKTPQNTSDDGQAQAYIQHLIVEVPRVLYLGTIGNQPGGELSVQLELDSEQAVERIKNLTVNSELKVPSGDLIEALNKLTMPVASLPAKHHIASLQVTILKDGNFNTDVKYRSEA